MGGGGWGYEKRRDLTSSSTYCVPGSAGHSSTLINLPHPTDKDRIRGLREVVQLGHHQPSRLTWGYPCPAELKRQIEQMKRQKTSESKGSLSPEGRHRL